MPFFRLRGEFTALASAAVSVVSVAAAAATTVASPTWATAGWLLLVVPWVWWQRFLASGFATLTFTPRLPSAGSQPLRGRVYVVTGTSAGCGYWTAVLLCRMGAHVVATCRTANGAESNAKTIATVAGEGVEAHHGKCTGLALELGTRASCEEFVVAFRGLGLGRLDGLVNNAGAVVPNTPADEAAGKRLRDGDGHELHVGGNFLSPLLIADLLMPDLRATVAAEATSDSSNSTSEAPSKSSPSTPLTSTSLTSPRYVPTHGVLSSGFRAEDAAAASGRVVFVASSLHGVIKTRDQALNGLAESENDTAAVPAPDTMNMYALSKFANVANARVTALEEHARSSGVTCVSVHPGVVLSNFGHVMWEKSIVMKALRNVLGIFLKTSMEGAYTSVTCVTAPVVRCGGHYCDSADHSNTVRGLSALGHDDETMRRVVAWGRSVLETGPK